MSAKRPWKLPTLTQADVLDMQAMLREVIEYGYCTQSNTAERRMLSERLAGIAERAAIRFPALHISAVSSVKFEEATEAARVQIMQGETTSPPDAGLSDEAIRRAMQHAYKTCEGDFDDSLQAALSVARHLLTHRAVTLPERDALARTIDSARFGKVSTAQMGPTSGSEFLADAVLAELRRLNAQALGGSESAT